MHTCMHAYIHTCIHTHTQVRHYAKPELKGYIRISVGKPEHTDAVLAALKSMA